MDEANKEKKKAQAREWEKNNKERKKQNQAIWREKNKERLLEKDRQRYHDNAEKFREEKRIWYHENKELANERSRQYRQKEGALEKRRESHRRWKSLNRDHINQKQREEYRNNQNFRICALLSKALRKNVKRNTNNIHTKETSITEILNKDVDSVRDYLESLFSNNEDKAMSWENLSEWAIDHRIPQSWFELSKIQHQKYAYFHKNLQPKWKEENLSKKDRYADVNGYLRITRDEWLHRLAQGATVLQLMIEILGSELTPEDVAYLKSIPDHPATE